MEKYYILFDNQPAELGKAVNNIGVSPCLNNEDHIDMSDDQSGRGEYIIADQTVDPGETTEDTIIADVIQELREFANNLLPVGIVIIVILIIGTGVAALFSVKYY